MPCRKIPRQRSRAEENKYRGSFPFTYSLLPLATSTCGESGSDVHALIKEIAVRRVQHRSETHPNESQHLAEGTEVARLRRQFSFVLQQALSFRTRHHLCRQGVALTSTRQLRSQGPASVQAHHTGWVTGSEGKKGANGVGGGIGVGGGNGDGNGVGGGNGDVNGHGDGDGARAATGTGVVVVVVVVVSHIQRIGCQPEKTTLHGGQSRSWSAEQGKENKRKSLAAYPPPPPHTARSEKINKITRRIYRRYAGGRSRVRTRIPSARRLGLWVWLRKILHSRLR